MLGGAEHRFRLRNIGLLVIDLFEFIFFASIIVVFTVFLFKTSVQFALKCFSLYSVCLCLSLCFYSIFFVLLDIANMS